MNFVCKVIKFLFILGCFQVFSDKVFSQTVNPCVEMRAKIKTDTGTFPIYFSPNGRFITQGGTKHLKVWDAETGELFKEYKGEKTGSTPVAFSKDNSLVAAGTGGKDIQVWEISSGRLLNKFETNYGDITDLTFNPNGNYIAASGSDYKIIGFSKKDYNSKVWEIETGILKFSFKPDVINARSVIFSKIAYSNDGKILISAFEDKIGLWNSNDGSLISYLIDTNGKKNELNEKSFGGIIGEMKLSPNGKILTTTTFYDGKTKLWEIPSGKLFLDTGQNAYSIDYSPNNELIVLGGKDKTARVWNIQEKQQVKLLKGHKRPVRRVSFSADGKLAATSDSENTYIWAVSNWEQKQVIPKAGYALFSPEGNTLATIHPGGLNNTIYLWSVNSKC